MTSRSLTLAPSFAPLRGIPRWPVWLLLAIVLSVLAHRVVRDAAAARELQEASARLQVLAGSLHNELSRHEALPGVLAMDSRLGDALANPTDRQRVDAANAYLRTVATRIGADAIFLMDRQGLTIASSNADTPSSFIGHNYGFRPYATDAFARGFGRFYAVGVTTGRPGYFLAASVTAPGGVRGVVALKMSLLPFEDALGAGTTPTVVADDNGVVMLASDPDLRYRTIEPLSDIQRERIRATRQYEGLPLQPLPVTGPAATGASAPEGLVATPVRVLQPVAGTGWRIVAYARTPTAGLLAGVSAALVFCLVAGAVLLAHSTTLRRQRRIDLLQREAEIQRRIEVGTRQLRDQLAEQARTEALLRETTDSAVQAGKLTVLGQMAAAMSHELNQPLTAMRNYAENSITLLDHDRTDAARANLDRIAQLADRMGQIVAHLRSHARKQPGPVTAVAVASAIEQANQLLEAGLHTRVPLQVCVDPPDLQALAQPVRLEQALVNLLRNAIEAQPSDGPPSVIAYLEGDQAVIEVHDTGPGLSPGAANRLFEPFFTTKPSGAGLGLGLAVSRMILRAMNGDLTAPPSGGRGAVFRIVLPRARPGLLDVPADSWITSP